MISFFLWECDERDAADLVEILNNNGWGIKFTLKFNNVEIEFLDVLIRKEKGRFSTSTFFKPVDSNSSLSFHSNHYRKWKENIPFGQMRRMRKNFTSDEKFEEQSQTIKYNCERLS